MAAKLLSREDLIARMRKKQGRRTQRTFAAELGISEPFLSDIYAGKRDPGPKVLTKLGLASLTAYREHSIPGSKPESAPKPQVAAREEASASGHNAESVEMDWLVRNSEALAQHEGEWLLIHGRQLIVHSRNFADLKAAIKDRQITAPFVYYVPTDEESSFVAI